MDGKKISSFVKSILMQYCAEPEQGIFVGRDNDIEAIVKALTTENKPCKISFLSVYICVMVC